MKLSDLPIAPEVTVRVRPVESSTEVLAEGAVKIDFSQYPGEFNLILNGSLITIAVLNKRDMGALSFGLSTGRATLAWLDAIAPDGSANLRLFVFNGEIAEMGVVEVGLDEKEMAAARRALGIGLVSDREVMALLAESCLLDLGSHEDDSYMLFTAGSAADENFDSVGDNIESIPTNRRSFCIHGDRIRLAVSRKQKSRDEEIFLVSRLTRSRAGQSDSAIRLGRARLSFSDYSRTGRIRAMVSGQMERLLSREESYLRKWDEYGEAEGRVLLERARAIGSLKYSKAEACSDGFTLFLDHPTPQSLSLGDELELTKVEPPYLKDTLMNWGSFCTFLEEKTKIPQIRKGRRGGRQKGENTEPSGEAITVVGLSKQSVTVNMRMQPPAAKDGFYLVLSMMGEQIQIQRRMEARRRVMQARSANPLLGVIIEDDADVPEVKKPPKVTALSAFVKDKVFPENPPTDRQEEAIRVALNTPDIALIQGPPGTGKTTVIAAILERLNELSDKRESIRGQVLLSGFQHDAVENMMLRLTVNSLPVPKFGRRRNDSTDLAEERVRQWCDQVAGRLRDKNPSLALSEQERILLIHYHHYGLTPSAEAALHLLDQALLLPRTVIPYGLVQELLDLKELLLDESKSEGDLEPEALRSVRAIRITGKAFQDDGPERASDVLVWCRESLNEEEARLLKKAACWTRLESPPFLAELLQLKQNLLDRFTPRPVFKVERAREDVLELIAKVMESVKRNSVSDDDKMATVLAEFLAGLESDPVAIQEAVADYSYAFAATCQQSEGKQIRMAKKSNTGRAVDETNSYDTVIVDEAARVGPRDLLVPMVQGKRRIILVGDHRQLPHLIDEEVVRALESTDSGLGATGAKSEDQLIKQSMFQYLFDRLGVLERRDGIQRRVTLDRQFRMHPLLGEFVSRNFYEPYSEGFTSPLPPESFEHSLPGDENIANAWIDVSSSEGAQSRRGTSWCRQAEAVCIAERLHTWIDSPQGQHLSFGVISFYKAQTEEIKAALAGYGYTHRTPEGSFEIANEYAFLPPSGNQLPEERLRIGTVDSFQGMEFDVVFLSIVRCNQKLPEPSDDDEEFERQGRRLFGHLMSPNRLCVSMSRQKRMLVVVGDSEMVTNAIAKRAVPGLANFYQLCQEKGAVW